jgi:chromosome segregation ATPase
MLGAEAAVDTEGAEKPQATREEPAALALSVDDFSALEERVRRAVDVVKRERQARMAAEARAAELEARATQAEKRQADFAARATLAEAQLQTQSPVVEQLQSELTALRTERDQVRQRVERLLKQLDTLEL